MPNAAIDQLIHRLRMKIEPTPLRPKRLISRKGFGYSYRIIPQSLDIGVEEAASSEMAKSSTLYFFSFIVLRPRTIGA